MTSDDGLDELDRDALQRAMSIAMRDEELSRTLQEKLSGDEFCPAEPWIEVAITAAYECQYRALHLKPWQNPPIYADESDKGGHALLRRMLDAGLSRYEPDPLRALEKNAKQIAKLRKKKPHNEKAGHKAR